MGHEDREVSGLPIYEYQCRNCGKAFEVFQKITDEPLQTCKYCSGQLRKLISISSFQLKGTGWYITDYKNKETKKEKPLEGGAEKTPETSATKADKTSEVTDHG